MPFTGPDSLQVFLSGAEFRGGVQTDPNASLGSYRSATRHAGLGFSIKAQIPNLRIEYVAPYNGVGAGTIRAVGPDIVRWTPPGGTEGPDVIVLNGETQRLHGGDDRSFLNVTRKTTDDMEGQTALVLAAPMNSGVGFDNVLASEQPAGTTRYRGLILWNRSIFPIDSILGWIEDGSDELAIGEEAVVSSQITLVANQFLAPGGVSFSAPTEEGSGMAISNMAANGEHGLWVRMTAAADAAATPFDLHQLRISFNASEV